MTAPEAVPPMHVIPLEAAVEAFERATKGTIATLQDAVISLRVQLFAERERADKAEKRVEELLARRWWRWGRYL